jgi:hypothetical protein
MGEGPLGTAIMPRDHAYELMRNALKAVLPSFETFARTAKSAPAKKNLMTQIEQIKEALKAAEQAGPPLPRLRDRVSKFEKTQNEHNESAQLPP